MKLERLGDLKGVEVASMPGKTMLELNKFVRRTTPHEAKAPQLLVLTGWRVSPEAWVREVPSHLWDRAAAGEMRLVIDVSGEGQEHSHEVTDQIHAFFAERRVKLADVIYLTQDRGYAADYARSRAPGEPRLRVHYADYYIRRFFLDVEARGAALFEERYENFRGRQNDRERRLISLNLSPRETKVLFLLRLMRDDLWNQAFVSFGGIGMNKRGKKPSYKRWRREVDELAPYLERLEGLGRFILGEDGDNSRSDYRTPVYDADMPEHDRSWFTVVTETEMRDRPSRITEKPCKALVNFHPLIFLGNPGALDQLREYGFRTFEGFFDESYDEELDAKRRFDRVYDQVVELCRRSDQDLARRAGLVEEALIHNARRGLVELPAEIRRVKDLELLKALLTD
jgi:hypothetical protein